MSVPGFAPSDRVYRHDPRLGKSSFVRRATTGLGTVPVIYLVIGLIAAVLIFVFIRFTVDDAFISWRYALTLIRHGQWNYSAGVPRVEGYTNFLYAAIAVIPVILHLPVEMFFKLVALAVLGAYLAAVRRVILSRIQKVALLAIVVCNPTFMILLFSGLETVSFAFLIALVFALVYRNGGLGVAGYVAALALALSRPEGIAFAGVAMLWSLVITRKPAQVRGLAIVGGLWALYWAARASYFGYFWPSTYYVKSGNRGPTSTQLVDVLNGLVPVVVVAGLVLMVVALAAQVDRRVVRGMLGRPQDATPVVLAVTSAVVVLGLYHSSTLAMNFVNRFQWQLLFPVVLVALSRPLGPAGRTERSAVGWTLPAPAELWAVLAVVVATATTLADSPSRLSQIMVTAGALVVAVAIALRGTVGRSDASILAAVSMSLVVSSATVTEMVSWGGYRTRLEYAHQAMGQVIDRAPFGGAVAIGDAGILPFTIHQPVLDMDGLANAAVAHGTFTSADLARAHVQMVIALSKTPGTGSEFAGGGLGAQVAYAYRTVTDGPLAGGRPSLTATTSTTGSPPTPARRSWNDGSSRSPPRPGWRISAPTAKCSPRTSSPLLSSPLLSSPLLSLSARGKGVSGGDAATVRHFGPAVPGGIPTSPRLGASGWGAIAAWQTRTGRHLAPEEGLTIGHRRASVAVVVVSGSRASSSDPSRRAHRAPLVARAPAQCPSSRSGNDLIISR